MGAYQLEIDNGIAPQITQMTPDGTLAASPAALTLFLNEVPLDPQTIVSAAFHLAAVDPSGAVTADLSQLLGTPQYDAATDRVTIPLSIALPDGRYQLTVSDSIQSGSGVALDGDQQNGAGGDFVGQFAVDATPPQLVTDSLKLAGVASTDASGNYYRFTGQVIDPFPAAPGQQVTVQLDVDGDNKFDDGSTTVALVPAQLRLRLTRQPLSPC